MLAVYIFSLSTANRVGLARRFNPGVL